MSAPTYGCNPGSPGHAALPVVRALLQSLRETGYEAFKVDYLGDGTEHAQSDDEAMEAIFAVDECRVYFRATEGRENEGERRPWVLINLMNGSYDPTSATDVIGDWVVGPNDFALAMDRFLDAYPERVDAHFLDVASRVVA